MRKRLIDKCRDIMKSVIQLRPCQDLKTELVRLADYNHRSLNQQVLFMLEEYLNLEREGRILPKTDQLINRHSDTVK